MRRSYIDSHCTLSAAFTFARRWADGALLSVLAPSTSAVEDSPWLEGSGIPIGTVGNRRSRFSARARGIVIAWCLDLGELLDLENTVGIDGTILVAAGKEHAPWITARHAVHIGGEPVPAVDEAPPAIKATVEGLSRNAVLNQGLIDSRERSAAIQALTYLRNHGHRLDPAQLTTEALRREWPRQSPLELAQIARDLNAGKRLRFQHRLTSDALARWAQGDPN